MFIRLQSTSVLRDRRYKISKVTLVFHAMLSQLARHGPIPLVTLVMAVFRLSLEIPAEVTFWWVRKVKTTSELRTLRNLIVRTLSVTL